MPTPASKNSIFRSKSVQKYLQNREKSILPRIVAPPVFILCWIILTLLIAAGIVIWMGQVPLYVTGQGIILNQQASAHQGDEATAAVLLPASDISHLRIGLPVKLQIGQTGPLLNRTIDAIGQDLLSPSEIRQQYGFSVIEPSFLVTVGLGSTVPGGLYAGSLVQAQIQIGSQSLLSLFPVLNSL